MEHTSFGRLLEWHVCNRQSSTEVKYLTLKVWAKANKHIHILMWSESHSVVPDSLRPHGLYSPWNSPGQNTGVSSLSLLQGIFPTQGSNPGFPHCRRILYQLSYKGSPRILEYVTCPFSSGFSWPRNQTRVSCIADGFFTNWAIRKAHITMYIILM